MNLEKTKTILKNPEIDIIDYRPVMLKMISLLEEARFLISSYGYSEDIKFQFLKRYEKEFVE